MKNIAEFLWGSPIVTGSSDEDWLILTDEQVLSRPLTLSESRVRYIEDWCIQKDKFPKFLYNEPHYHIFALFPNEYYIDEAAVTQIEQIISMREDAVRMNFPVYYQSVCNYLHKINITIDCEGFSNKRVSKAIQTYIQAEYLASGYSMEEARAAGIIAAAPIKLGKISQEESLALLNEHRARFNDKKIADFFNKEPNIQTYETIIELVNSIDIKTLSGIPVQGQFPCPITF